MAKKASRKTKKHTDVTGQNNAKALIREAAMELLAKIQSDGLTLAGTDFLALQNNSYQSVAARTESDLDNYQNPVRRLLASELLINAERIERQCAGAGILFAKTFLRVLANAEKLDQSTPSTTNLAQQFETLKTGLVQDYVELPHAIMNKRTNRFKEKPTEPVWRALNLAGLLGTVGVEKYKDTKGGSETIIERHSGHHFRIDVMRTFIGSLSLVEFGNWDQREVRVLIVDGVLNSVAEIDKILLGSAKNKQPTLIIASYFEEEVVATVAANNISGRTCIYLGLLPRDTLDGVNMANDISVCCLANPVNSHSGYGLLSFLEFDSLPVVDRVHINSTTNTLTITNPKAHGAVETQIRTLQEKLSELSKDGNDKVRVASAELLNKRISNLIADKVVIKVPDNKARVLIPAIDNQIRFAKSLLLHGQLKPINRKFKSWFLSVCDQDKLTGLVGRFLLEELQTSRQMMVVGMTPYIVLWFATKLAKEYLETRHMVLAIKN